MASITLLFLAATFLLAGINGKRIRTPCGKSHNLRCDNSECWEKHRWCDGEKSCSDGSDEKYCSLNDQPTDNKCNDDIHFRCENGKMCIPIEGYCDGYSSCSDQSDEKGCPCEELLGEEGYQEIESFIRDFRTQQECWKITVKEGQYVVLNILGKFHKRDCIFGNVTLFSDAKDEVLTNSSNVICPQRLDSSGIRFNLYENTLIRYRSNLYAASSTNIGDFIKIKYEKIDVMCDQPDAFKCSARSCIAPEKQCDGIKDCQNGSDEENCDFSPSYLETIRKKAIQWMWNQHNADWGWKDNTHKAVVALYLAGGLENANSFGKHCDYELIAKQLELEVSTFLLRYKSSKKSASELSAYINALLAICHDPRNFYGHNLVATLEQEIQQMSTKSAHPSLYLTLCNAKNAKEPIPDEAMDRLQEMLQKSQNNGFALEFQSLVIMAITCAINKNDKYFYLKQNISEALNSLKKEQKEDGSFGNEYTTAFILQALIANSEEQKKDWNTTTAIQFLKQQQETEGSFKDILLTYLVLPLLNGKSLLDVGRVNCTESLKRPRDGGSDIQSKLREKIIVKYSLFIGDERDQIFSILLRVPENITVLELMNQGADFNVKYKFKTHEVRKMTYVYEISNIPNDPESNTFWFLYEGVENSTITMSEQNPDKVKVKNKEHIIMWYKTQNFI